MTIPDERSRAVKYAREFLRDLLDSGITPRVPRSVREQARRVLKHFPSDLDVNRANERVPETFGKLSYGEKYEGLDDFAAYRKFRASLYGVRRSRLK